MIYFQIFTTFRYKSLKNSELRLALLNPWLAPWIGYRTADGYFSTACSEYLMSTIKSLVPCWNGWK